MKKETLIKILDIVKVIVTIVAGYLGGAAVSSCAHALCMYP